MFAGLGGIGLALLGVGMGVLTIGSIPILLIMLVRSAARGPSGKTPAGRQSRPGPASATGWACANTRCQAENRSHARYCRMCGHRRTRPLFSQVA